MCSFLSYLNINSIVVEVAVFWHVAWGDYPDDGGRKHP
jgi:hypothetical protein